MQQAREFSPGSARVAALPGGAAAVEQMGAAGNAASGLCVAGGGAGDRAFEGRPSEGPMLVARRIGQCVAFDQLCCRLHPALTDEAIAHLSLGTLLSRLLQVLSSRQRLPSARIEFSAGQLWILQGRLSARRSVARAIPANGFCIGMQVIDRSDRSGSCSRACETPALRRNGARHVD